MNGSQLPLSLSVLQAKTIFSSAYSVYKINSRHSTFLDYGSPKPVKQVEYLSAALNNSEISLSIRLDLSGNLAMIISPGVLAKMLFQSHTLELTTLRLQEVALAMLQMSSILFQARIDKKRSSDYQQKIRILVIIDKIISLDSNRYSYILGL